jgi:hypothetical protein
MRVWIVIYDDGLNEYEICGVFSSFEKATEYVNKSIEEKLGHEMDFDTFQFDLDSPPPVLVIGGEGEKEVQNED